MLLERIKERAKQFGFSLSDIAEKLEKRVDFGRIWWYPNKAVREGGPPQALRRTGFLNLLRIKFTKDEKTC